MKYVKEKVIYHKPFYYFEYVLREGKRKETFTRYLGKTIPPTIKDLMLTYADELGSITAKKTDSKYFLPQMIAHIERAKFRYRFLNHELFTNELQEFKMLFIILFVLNSNRSEGSKVTRANIEQVISKRRKPRTLIELEVVNSFKAIDFAFSKDMRWNAKSIKHLHALLFAGLQGESSGQYKKVDNIVGNSSTTSYQEVPQAMKKLLEWLKIQKKLLYSPELALEFHWRFEEIHPFEDGNGRVGRILLNAMLIQQGFAPVIYFTENHRAYCQTIGKAREGRSLGLAKHYVKSVKKTDRAIEEYKQEKIVSGGSPHIGRWEIQKGKIRLG